MASSAPIAPAPAPVPARARGGARVCLTAIACCAMVCGTILLAPVVQAGRQDGGSAAAIVATIDLERVIDSLDAMDQANGMLEAEAARLQADIQRKREQLELLDEEIELLVGQQRDEKLALAERMADELKITTEMAQWKLEGLRVRALREIYESVREKAAELSRANGWDLVLVNDSLVEVPAVGSQAELMRQISARRVIYGDARIDVTNILIAAMNGAG
jgi:Skp family chaperone for outer membrane proteins